MNFIPATSYTNYIDANIILGRLQNEGIECWLKDENTVTIYPILTNAVGGIKLMVAEPDAGKATELLNLFRTEQKQQMACPRCSSHNVELISSNRKPGNWLSVIVGFSFTSFAPPVETAYHCFDCTHEFNLADNNDVSS